MPNVSPDQGLTYPADPDSADNPVAFANFIGGVENRLNRRYANAADRTARDLAPAENQVTALAAEDRIEVHDGANYVSLHHRALYAEIRKILDETITSNAVDQPDDVLTVAVAANSGTYRVRITFFYSSSTTADLRCRINGPAGATGRIGISGIAASTAATTGDVSAGSVTVESGTDLVVGGAGVGTGNALMAILEGDITIAGTAGSITFNWAQNASDATNTTVYARSLMQVWRVV